MLKINRYLHIIFPVVVLITLNCYFLLNYTSIYGVNDDFLLNEMLSGNYVDDFLTHVTYIQQPVTGILNLLYRINPNINFYAYLILFLFNISLFNVSLANYVNKKNRFKLIDFVIWAISSFIILSWFILSPTFTAASLMICSSSLLLIYISIQRHNFNKYIFIYSILLWIFGYFLRVKGGAASLITWMPIIFFASYTQRKFLVGILKDKRKTVVKLLTFSSLVFIFSNLDINSDKEYSNYLEYNAVRQELTNTTRIIELSEIKSSINWSDDQYNLFIGSAYADKISFGYDQLAKAVTLTSESQGIRGLIHPKGSIVARISTLKNFYWFFICIFILPLFYFTLSSKFSRSELIKLSVFCICNIFAIYFVLATGKYEERVIFPLILNFWMILFSIRSRSKFGSYLKIFPILLSLILFLFSYEKLTHKPIYYKESNKWNAQANSFWLTQEKSLKSLPTDSIFVGPISYFRANWSDPFESNPDVGIKYLSLGWHTFSPAWEHKRNDLLGNRDSLYNSLISKENVYWISDPTTASSFFRYLESLQVLKYEPKLILSIGDKDNIYGGEYNVYSLNK